VIETKQIISTNPLNGKEYVIPESQDDSGNIDNFLKENEGKKTIVVQGLGFVGAVMSIVCANALTEEYAVIGIDLANKHNYWKIMSINEGSFPIIADGSCSCRDNCSSRYLSENCETHH